MDIEIMFSVDPKRISFFYVSRLNVDRWKIQNKLTGSLARAWNIALTSCKSGENVR